MTQVYTFAGFAVDLRVSTGPVWDFPASDYLPIDQVHGNRVYERCTDNAATQLQADGHWTRASNTWVGVRTADCIPLLLAHPRAVAALHAGWRGVHARIVEALYLQWQAAGFDLAETRWVVGPHIMPDSFQVGPDLLAAFADRSYRDELVLHRSDGSACFDLLACVLADVAQAGFPAPKLLHRIGGDTLTNAAWPSYRRDGESAGRLCMSICRTEP